MARVITPAKPEPASPAWTTPGEEVIVLALDKNEVCAIVSATSEYRRRVENNSDADSTSLNASGARVHDALRAVKRERGWS